MPVMCLPQDVNIYPFVQLCVQLPMKHHTGIFLVSLNNPSLAPATSGHAYMRRQVRANKTKPLVDEVGMLQANPHYTHVRYPDGRETLHLSHYLLTCSKSVPWGGNTKTRMALPVRRSERVRRPVVRLNL